MASPPRGSPTNSSSSPRAVTIPVRDGSPIRRRRSGSQASDNETRLRLSPSMVRSLNPNDPEFRARQRELDLDMAAHLSRARQNSVSISPVVTPFHPLPPATSEPSGLAGSGVLPPFSEGEEREFEAARAGGNASAAPTIDIDAKSEFHFSRSDPTLSLDDDAHLHHLSAGHDPDLLFAHQRSDDRTPMQHAPRPGAGVHDEGGEPFLPSYAPQMYESNFDFGLMEEFAREEKRRLGLDSPTGPPNGGLRWMDLTSASRRLQNSGAGPSGSGSGLLADPDTEQPGSPEGTVNGDAEASTGHAPRIRHRKLSQSKTTPRTQRPGKKTALFEGAAGAPPPTLGTPIGRRNLPSYENVFGDRVPTTTTPGGHGHDRPYRFSFYSNAQSATIHARSLAELPAEGQTFEDLFIGLGVQRDNDIGPKTSAKGSGNGDGSNIGSGRGSAMGSTAGTPSAPSNLQEANRRISLAKQAPFGGNEPVPGYATLSGANSKTALNSNPLSQEHNTWWLDVLNPTDEEMKMLAKVFSIHPLTTEDILMEETREKIELFRNYYLVCFRGFDQDPYSPTHLEPLNMYIIVFREGTLSFHFRATPHPQNVRRRIKQLKDYISVSSDWISYALIDDITDAFGPLIQSIEYEVDSIDELVLILKEAEQSDMLRRIGTCRKKVMGLLRLMGNKADVVKGLAKRCNENWRVAPTSDIGLYLSDIQDHLITMTQNLNHYEKILSRSHSNYLAQISIEMTEANNQINDVLSKMTALGTVLIPMNLVTGLWGMNVNVPGQEAAGLIWFFSILAGLVAFAVVGGYVTFRLMSGR